MAQGFPAHVFREYDIRGDSEADLSSDLAQAIGCAFATKLRRELGVASSLRLTVAVGRDCRLSSDRLYAAFAGGLRASGADVIDIGVGPTPLLYFAAHHLESDGAAMITGSHNPPGDNGFKLMKGKGTLFGADIQELGRMVAARDFVDAPGGSERQDDVSEAYVAAVRKATRFDATLDRPVVVDAGNGAAGPLGLRTLRALGMTIDPLFCEMDGRFPNHHPDPTIEANIEALRQRVRATGAMLGIAWDGDGDRIGAIDEEGEVVWGDKLLILFSRALLREHPGAAVLGEVKCSQTLFDDIARHGGRPIVCRTGHSLIKKRMKEEKALLAGEMSGHMFFADRYFGFDDAIYAAARLIELTTREGKSPRAMLADVPHTAVTPEIRVDCPDAIKFGVVERVLAHYRPSHAVIDVDGARIDFGDGAWGLCRASNTGAVLVLRFEARTSERRDAIRAEVEAVVASAVAALRLQSMGGG
jgi:phosphomannomutase/phosphoglucomutase